MASIYPSSRISHHGATHLELRAEFFNLTNHPNFSIPGFSGNGVVAAPGSLDYTSPSTFGTISSTRDGSNDQREIQFALSFTFENRKRVATKAAKEDPLHRQLRYGKNNREHDSRMVATIDAGRDIAPSPG